MLFALAVPVCAAGLPLVVDDAALLSADEESALSAEAQRLSDAYQMDVVILTAQRLGGKTPRDYAADYFDYNGYGRGPSHDGVMLMLSMEDRDWFILTTGRGINAVTDYGVDVISDDIVPSFSEGDYANGFARFLHDVDVFLKQFQTGRPYDVDKRVQLRSPFERATGIAVYLAIAAAVIAGIVLVIMILGMKTARPKPNATEYVKDGSLNITRSQDIYLYHTQTRVRVPKESSSGGGSSTFRSSSGRSHGGGGGKF
jgi:uncharacterized protein